MVPAKYILPPHIVENTIPLSNGNDCRDGKTLYLHNNFRPRLCGSVKEMIKFSEKGHILPMPGGCGVNDRNRKMESGKPKMSNHFALPATTQNRCFYETDGLSFY